jgi:transposase-like protein
VAASICRNLRVSLSSSARRSVSLVAETLVACTRCGKQRAADCSPVEAMSWSSERERGAQRWLCPECSRTHVRDIEGKLPVEYW